MEQIFSEGIEVERVARLFVPLALLADLLEGHRQPRLAGTVVAVEQDGLLLFQHLPKMRSQRGQVDENLTRRHSTAPSMICHALR